MLKNKLSLASLIMLAAWGSLHAAEPAGRVLVLQGTAVAVRGAKEVPLVRGASVESGDLLRVSDSSSLQVRFTDESVVALRANTQFKIEDYKFTEKGEGDKSIFGLLKGGMRTITGLIGKRNPEAYEMRGATATIGIRGTGYTAVNCAGDCFNPDGSKVEDGLYGGVSIGRIVVKNQAGEMEFVRDQYFTVGSSNNLPRQLLAPPGFLRDKLDGMAKAGKSSQGKTAEVTVSGGTTSTQTTSPAPTLSSTSLTSVSTTSSSYSAADAAPSSPLLTPPSTGTGEFSYSHVWASASKDNLSNYHYSSTWGYYNLTYSSSYDPNIDYLQYLMSAQGPSKGTYTDTAGVTYNSLWNKTASTDTGSWAGPEGTVSWGRYHYHSKNTKASDNTVIYDWDQDEHWVFGPAVKTLPTSGTFTFAHIGGSRPTDQAGQLGTITNGGAWTVNFTNSTIHSAAPVAWTMPGGASYQVNVSSPTTFSTFNSSSAATAGTTSGSYAGVNSLYLSGSNGGGCSGNGCSLQSVQVNPQFNGTNATGLGVGIATSATTNNGSQHTAQVRVYKRQ